MFEGLYVSAARGTDGTGIAFIKHGEEKQTPTIYKDSIHPFDYVHRPFVVKQLKKVEDFSMVLGHTRSSTRGNATRSNTHPFQHRHITLVHNGTVENAYELTPALYMSSPEIIVDSHRVAVTMGELKAEEDEISVLERLKGPFALIWHNSRDGSLNFSRNEKKPLYFAFVEKENTMCWASEYNLLAYLMERRGLEIDDKIYFPEPNKWYKFKVDDLRKTLAKKEEYVRPFVHQKSSYPPYTPEKTTNGKTTDITGATHHGHFDNRFIEPTPEELANIRKQALADNANSVLTVDNVKDWLKEHRKDPLFSRQGTPTTHRKIGEAVVQLEKFGLRFGQQTAFFPRVFRPYKQKRHQKVVCGDVVGETVGGKKAIMTSVAQDKFDLYIKLGKIFVRAVNTKIDKTGERLVVIVEHEMNVLRERHFLANLSNPKEFLRQAKTDSTQDEGERESVPLLVKGPGQREITADKFDSLVKYGCCECQCDISVHDANDVLWVGDQPLCWDCSQDHSVMVRCGLAMPVTMSNPLSADGEIEHLVH